MLLLVLGNVGSSHNCRIVKKGNKASKKWEKNVKAQKKGEQLK